MRGVCSQQYPVSGCADYLIATNIKSNLAVDNQQRLIRRMRMRFVFPARSVPLHLNGTRFGQQCHNGLIQGNGVTFSTLVLISIKY